MTAKKDSAKKSSKKVDEEVNAVPGSEGEVSIDSNAPASPAGDANEPSD